MLNYKTPLNAEESAFAAENHDLIYVYLKRSHLPENDFYDIAVFGYLRAVRKYLARPELRQYKFSTIAFRAMSCDVHHSKEYWNRDKRRGTVLPLNEDLDAGDLRDTVAETVDNIIFFEQCVKRLTPAQRRIATLRDHGYSDHEIAAVCGIGRGDVEREMEDARCRILNFPMNSAALAA